MCNIMSIIIVFIIMYIYYLTVYMFCISCYGTNKLLLCDFCTFVQINSIKKNAPGRRGGGEGGFRVSLKTVDHGVKLLELDFCKL